MRITNKMNTIALALSGLAMVATTASAQGTKVTPTPTAISKITNMSITNDNIVDGQKLDITVSGEGKACNYYLTLTNTDTQQEWPLPKISNFPAPDKILMDLPYQIYPHGNYKFTAKARPNDVRPGQPCQGGGNYIAFKNVRAKILLAAEAPKIVDVLTEPGKKMGGTNRYRSDERIKFNVVGTVENTEAKDVANKCGWTAQLVDKNGVAKDIGKDGRFGVWQDSQPLTGVATGEYTLTIKTTAADDGLAKQPCLGKVTKKVEVFAAPGVINGVDLASKGSRILANEEAVLWITPRISGATCTYKVTRKINNGKSTSVTTHVFTPGDAGPVGTGSLLGETFPDDETLVEVTVGGSGFINSCESVATKRIRVYDADGKAGVVF